MSAPKYYAAEEARWPCAGWMGLSKWEAEEGIKRLCRHFRIALPRLNLREAHRESGRANAYMLTMSIAGGWRLLAHELAHTWHSQRCHRETRLALVRGEETVTVPWHGKDHRRLVDRILRYVERQGWHRGGLAEAAAYRERQARDGKAERMAACPSPLESRIAHREEQVARLTRKIKALETRRRTAMRSLAALRRRR
jgi:hypothetical protein